LLFMQSGEIKKIILDTDIGSDIDDCFALAYLLSRTDVEILGITTVSGAPELRAKLADKICKSFGKSIPICVGNEKSSDGQIRQPRLTKAQTAVALSNKEEFSASCAAEFMKSIIDEYPGEVTLVCIGQATNAAALLSEYPDISGILAGMVIMGGRYSENDYCDLQKWGVTEWNILCDIKAAKNVFEKCPDNTVVIGIEQTCRFSRPSALIKEAFAKTNSFSVISDCISATVKEVYFHDAIAVYAWLNSEEVKLERGNIEVAVCDTNEKAETVFTPLKDGNCLLVADFSPEKFFADYRNVVGIYI